MSGVNPNTPFALGGASVNLVAGPSIAVGTQSGILVNSDTGVGDGLEYNGIGDYTLNLAVGAQASADDMYVMVQAGRSAVGSISANVNKAGLPGALNILFFDEADAPIDTSFDVLLFKHPTG